MNSLLQDIEQEIQKAGGKLNLCLLLMDENRFSFPAEERIQTRKEARAESIENYQPESAMYWTLKDEAYLQANWPIRSQRKVAHKLRRTVWGCYLKYYKLQKTKQTNIRNYRWKIAS